MKLHTEAGIAAKQAEFTTVKKVGSAGERIPAHNHPEAWVQFTVVRGKIRLLVGEDCQEVVPGVVASWDGQETISAEFLEDSEAFVTLVLKQVQQMFETAH